MKNFADLLTRKGCSVSVIDDLHEPLDALVRRAEEEGRRCVLLSFSPPHRSRPAPPCPAVLVFAWEFDTIPTEVWCGESRNDWRTVLSNYGCALTHSRFAAEAVTRTMGESFPVLSIPAPVWTPARAAATLPDARREPLTLEPRLVLDTRSDGFDRGLLERFVDPAPERRGLRRVLARWRRSLRKRLQAGRTSAETGRAPAGRRTIRIAADDVLFVTVLNPLDGRKNWRDALTAFAFACRDRHDATLMFKIVSVDPGPVFDEFFVELLKLPPFACRILVVADHFDEATYRRLVARTDWTVNTSLGEGQCLPLMEFMATGVPAVAPDHTAMAEYVDEEDAFVVASAPEPCSWPHDPRHAVRAMRHRIDWASARDAFADAYDCSVHRPEEHRRKSAAAVDAIRRFCSDEVVFPALMSVVASLRKA